MGFGGWVMWWLVFGDLLFAGRFACLCCIIGIPLFGRLWDFVGDVRCLWGGLWVECAWGCV